MNARSQTIDPILKEFIDLVIVPALIDQLQHEPVESEPVPSDVVNETERPATSVRRPQ